MNLPTQLICLPSVAASCLPIATRSIFSPLITTVAFGSTLPSAGLITVAPTSETFSARMLIAHIMQTTTIILFISRSVVAAFVSNAELNKQAFGTKRLYNSQVLSNDGESLFFRFRHSFLRGFETDLGMRPVAKRFFGRRAAATQRHAFLDGKFVSICVDQFQFARHDVRSVPDCLDCYLSHADSLADVNRAGKLSRRLCQTPDQGIGAWHKRLYNIRDH